MRRRRLVDESSGAAGTFAYADPPYPGTSSKYYRHESTYKGEVDFKKLIASLAGASYTGWAMSTSARSLRDILPLCPPGARVHPWVKPIGVPPATYGPHNAWEPLIVMGGRKRRPGTRDWLRAQPARRGGDLPGRKPLAFCAFLFDMLGLLPGDTLIDMYPGTGVVLRAWEQASFEASGDVSSGDDADVSSGAGANGKPVVPRSRTEPVVALQGRRVAKDPSDD